jgi:CelD/BcsL family acetyltransferase involved in cellulose biosynthesis
MPGYDPAFASHSPGLVLLPRLIEDLVTTRAADSVDFGAGDADYKRMFANTSFQGVHALLTKRRPYPWAAAQLERAVSAASRQGARLLDRWRLKSWLKSLIRAKATRE